MEEGFFGPSYSFSGPGTDNNRFVVEWMSEFGPFSLDYEGLEIADFKRQVDQRRQDQFEFLTEGREEYALTPGFVDYATAFIKYEWAQRMISYPWLYRRANGRENRAVVPAYYDFLLDIPLADEKSHRHDGLSQICGVCTRLVCESRRGRERGTQISCHV